MKKSIVTLVLGLCAFVATTAFAQANFTLQADVPFPFSIEDRHFDSGSYQVRTINSSTVRLLNIKTGDAGLIRIMISDLGQSPGNKAAPVLRFVVNGEHAYLLSMTDGSGNSWQVPGAARELEMARQNRSTNVVVALK